jgi:hypothetical protein
MSNWSCLTITTMTVGGGFAGTVITLIPFFPPKAMGFADVLGTVFFMCLFLFVLIAGLLFVNNPGRLTPLVIAFALQVPCISFAAFGYRFATGLSGEVGFSQLRLYGALHLGWDYRLWFGEPAPRAFGINVVALLVLVKLIRAIARRRHDYWPQSPVPPALEPDRELDQPQVVVPIVPRHGR